MRNYFKIQATNNNCSITMITIKCLILYSYSFKLNKRVINIIFNTDYDTILSNIAKNGKNR